MAAKRKARVKRKGKPARPRETSGVSRFIRDEYALAVETLESLPREATPDPVTLQSTQALFLKRLLEQAINEARVRRLPPNWRRDLEVTLAYWSHEGKHREKSTAKIFKEVPPGYIRKIAKEHRDDFDKAVAEVGIQRIREAVQLERLRRENLSNKNQLARK